MVPQISLRAYSYLLRFKKPCIISEINWDYESHFWDQFIICMPAFIASSVTFMLSIVGLLYLIVNVPLLDL